jgi:hypothetical protein
MNPVKIKNFDRRNLLTTSIAIERYSFCPWSVCRRWSHCLSLHPCRCHLMLPLWLLASRGSFQKNMNCQDAAFPEYSSFVRAVREPSLRQWRQNERVRIARSTPIVRATACVKDLRGHACTTITFRSRSCRSALPQPCVRRLLVPLRSQNAGHRVQDAAAPSCRRAAWR